MRLSEKKLPGLYQQAVNRGAISQHVVMFRITAVRSAGAESGTDVGPGPTPPPTPMVSDVKTVLIVPRSCSGYRPRIIS